MTYEKRLVESKRTLLYSGDRMSQYLITFDNYEIADEKFYKRLAAEKRDLFGSHAWEVAYIGIGFVIVTIHWD